MFGKEIGLPLCLANERFIDWAWSQVECEWSGCPEAVSQAFSPSWVCSWSVGVADTASGVRRVESPNNCSRRDLWKNHSELRNEGGQVPCKVFRVKILGLVH